MKNIDRLIVNTPFDKPSRHWTYDPVTAGFSLDAGRRPAGPVRASGSGSSDDTGIFIGLELPNRIRERVGRWRAENYAGVTSVTRRLLEHWSDKTQRSFPFFFCQLEAIKTLIWLGEAPLAEKQGITIPSDGGPFQRLCSKMATGSGKTLVMAMLIAWHAINKATNPQEPRFAKNVLIIGPGLTVKQRLQVLRPSDPHNYYDDFNIVPTGMRYLINQTDPIIEGKLAFATTD